MHNIKQENKYEYHIILKLYPNYNNCNKKETKE